MRCGKPIPDTMLGRSIITILAVALNALMMLQLHAERIGQSVDINPLDQLRRFVALEDPALRFALAGGLILGLLCGLMGSFLVVRKLSLVGDTISHAVLPGVAAGFLWNMEKDPVAILIGATTAGLLGMVLVTQLTRRTRLKEDTAMGMVLAGFFGIGICMMGMIQRLPTGSKSGIDKFLFGQAASLGWGDIQLMSVVGLLVLILILTFYKELLTTSFDPQFSGSIQIPVHTIEHGFMLLLAFAIVISLEAVGVVLVSAMLIIPAATAYLLCDRMHWMLFWACLIGMIAGAGGAFFSFLGQKLPTGPFMVLSASGLFALALAFAPRQGLVSRWWARHARSSRIRRENALKSIFHVLEKEHFAREGVTLIDLAHSRSQTLHETEKTCRELTRAGLASIAHEEKAVYLTPEGMRRAQTIVRNHRLWERYLTDAANYRPDHVHDDAEEIEHVLGEATVRMLERQLNFVDRDPHGKPIPSIQDISGQPKNRNPDGMTGYHTPS
jgi:ABC-type Mn2+/Zn2+ transport system permease subunit/Mn-dependent DtxR family transcriptional regulator